MKKFIMIRLTGHPTQPMLKDHTGKVLWVVSGDDELIVSCLLPKEPEILRLEPKQNVPSTIKLLKEAMMKRRKRS